METFWGMVKRARAYEGGLHFSPSAERSIVRIVVSLYQTAKAWRPFQDETLGPTAPDLAVRRPRLCSFGSQKASDQATKKGI